MSVPGGGSTPWTARHCSHLKRSIGNLAVNGVDHLLATIKNGLKSIQYRTDLLRQSPHPYRRDPRSRHNLTTQDL
jgi:hypothetical protein